MLVLLDSADCPVATSARPWARLMARVRASRLDSDLAGEASPDSTVALALRAQLLVSERTRCDLAEGVRRLLATAMQAPAADRAAAPADRAAAPADRAAAPADRAAAPADRAAAPAADRSLAPALGRSPVSPADRSPAHGARGPQMLAARRPRVPICRDRVRESAEELEDLIRRLLAHGPVAARGVALASALLSDGSGPLYHRANPDDLRARVREAVTALDPLTG
jgi:hypothetical protein